MKSLVSANLLICNDMLDLCQQDGDITEKTTPLTKSTNINPDKILLGWKVPPSCEFNETIAYNIEVHDVNDNIVFKSDRDMGGLVNDNSYSLSLDSNSLYYWAVFPRSSNGKFGQSSWNSFTTGTRPKLTVHTNNTTKATVYLIGPKTGQGPYNASTKIGTSADTIFSDVHEGVYDIKITANGFNTYTISNYSISYGTNPYFAATLSPASTPPTTGTLNITVTPSTGTITVNGDKRTGLWSGKVPSGYNTATFGQLPGYNTPAAITVDVPAGGFISKNVTYTALSRPVISGYIKTTSGTPISGVSVAFSNSVESVTTDSNGYYNNDVSNGWSGMVTPSLSYYTFGTPKSYSNITANQSNQNYTGTELQAEIKSVAISQLVGSKADRGKTYTISWSNNNNVGNSVKIELLQNGSASSVITSNATNNGTYSWVIPATLAAKTYSIRISSLFNSNCTDGVSGTFDVAPGPEDWSGYYYWNFDTNGAEGWTGRNATISATTPIFNNQYLMVYPYPSLDTSKSGVVSPPNLTAVHTNDFTALQVTASVRNTYVADIDAYFKIGGQWRGPSKLNYVSGVKGADKVCVYKGNIGFMGQIEQVRVDFVHGSNTVDDTIAIDKIEFIRWSDSTQPVATIGYPPNGSTLTVNTPVMVNFYASDNTTLDHIIVSESYNGGATKVPVANCAWLQGSATTCTWIPTTLSNNARIIVEAYDPTGNIGISSNWLTVQASPPPCSSPITPVLYDPGQYTESNWFSFFWQDNRDATRYIVREARSPSFSPATEFTTTTDTFMSTNMPNGMYYYQVKAVNNCGQSSWSNTIDVEVRVNAPPNTPSSPSPEDGASGVNRSASFSWVGGDAEGQTDYYLEFGKDPHNMWSAQAYGSANAYNTNYTPLDPLDGGTVYYWRVKSKDSQGLITEGPIWTFTTAYDFPDMEITSFTVDGTIQNNSMVTANVTIKNSGSYPANGGKVKFYYSSSPNGEENEFIYALVNFSQLQPGESTVISKQVTLNNIIAGTSYLVTKIDTHDYYNEPNQSNNKSSYTINYLDSNGPRINWFELRYSSTGKYKTDTTYQFVYVVFDDIKATGVDLYYSIDNDSNWTSIANNVQITNGGHGNSYSWTIPSGLPLVNTFKVKMVAWDSTGNSSSSILGPYEIIDGSAPVVNLTSPTTGDIWDLGTTHNVTWDIATPNGVSRISIRYHYGNQVDYLTEPSLTTNTGSFPWTIRNISSYASVNARISMEVTDGNGNQTIVYSPYFTVRDTSINSQPWIMSEKVTSVPTVTTPYTTWENGTPLTALDDSGNLHLAYVYSEDIILPERTITYKLYYTKQTSGIWSTPMLLKTLVTKLDGGGLAGLAGFTGLKMALDHNNLPHFVWQDRSDDLAEIYYANLNGTSLSEPVNVSNNNYEGSLTFLDLPYPPESCSSCQIRFASIGNYIYASGFNYYLKLYRFDTSSNSWTQMADSSYPGIGADNGDLKSLNGLLYMVDGQGVFQEYNPSTGAWTTKASLLSSTSGHTGVRLVAINGKMYAVGGGSSSGSTMLQEYNPATNIWTQKASMQVPVGFTSVAVLNNKIIVAGGFSNGRTTSKIQEYDPNLNTWNIKHDIEITSYRPSAAVINNRVYFVTDGFGIQMYDPNSNNWYNIYNNNIRLAAEDIVTVNDNMYIINDTSFKKITISGFKNSISTASLSPNIVIDSNNVAHIQWIDNRYDIGIDNSSDHNLSPTQLSSFYNKYEINNNIWSTSSNITPISTYSGCIIGKGNNNYIHQVCPVYDTTSSREVLKYQKYNGTGWTSAVTIVDFGYNHYRNLAIALDSQNDIHIVFTHQDTNYKKRIFYIKTQAGVWQTAELVKTNEVAKVSVHLDIADKPVILYSNSGKINYFQKIGQGQWTSDITANLSSQYADEYNFSSVTDRTLNRLHLAYTASYSGHREVFYTYADMSKDMSPPVLSILAPQSTETLSVESNYAISWSATDNISVSSVSLKYTTDGGATFASIATGLANTGSYFWMVPNITSDLVEIYLTASDSSGNQSTAKTGLFSIKDKTGPVLSLTSPLGGEILNSGSTHAITWSASDTSGVSSINLYYSTDDTNWMGLATNLSNTGTASWVVPKVASNTFKVKVIAVDANNNSSMATSNAFTVRTVNTAPVSPFAPSPSVGTTLTTAAASLSWQSTDADNDALTFDVYFGTSTTPPRVASAQSTKNYPVMLSPNRTYYWQIMASDGKSTTASPVWSFSSGEFTPASPSNLTAQHKSFSSTHLAWTDNSTSETNFIVERKIGLHGTYAKISKPDILYQDQVTGVLKLAYMAGTTGRSSVTITPVQADDPNWAVVGTGDFDADGWQDILMRNVLTGDMKVWFMKNQTHTSIALLSPTTPNDTNWTVSAIADMNNDGSPDIVFFNTQTGAMMVWYMSGITRTSAATLTTAPALDLAWQPVGSADFNSDGNNDILMQNINDGHLQIWMLLNGEYGGTSLVNTEGRNLADWRVIGIADFNADGHPDIMLQNKTSGEQIVFSLTGTVITDQTSVQSGIADTNLKAVALGDFDNDGLLPANSTEYTDLALSGHREYFYRVKVVNDSLTSGYSNESMAVTPNGSPKQPVAISPLDGQERIPQRGTVLSWQSGEPDGDSVQYDVYFGTTFDPPVVLTNATSTTYALPELAVGTIYHWRIVAKDSYGVQVTSPTWTFVSQPQDVPQAPCNLIMSIITGGIVKLEWSANSVNETGFVVERKDGDVAIFKEIVTTTTSYYFDMPAIPNISYYYRVKAINSSGDSAYSNTISIAISSGDSMPPTTSISVDGGYYPVSQYVVLSCSDGSGSGCNGTYFTTDGTTPNLSSNLYSGAIPVTSNTMLKYFSVDNAGNLEPVKEESFTLFSTLTVNTIGSGIGIVNSTVSSIPACSGSCLATVTAATNITLTAHPVTGHTFAGWSGACSGTSACVISSNGDKSVVANFVDPTAQQLTLSFSGTGGGSVSGDINCTSGLHCLPISLPLGTVTNILAIPDAYSTFAGWSGACIGTGDCNMTMDADKFVTAIFTSAPKVKVGTKEFSTLQLAYEDAATLDNAVIKLLEGTLTGNFSTGTKGISVTFEGGYNAKYSAITGETTIQGKMTIKSGTIRINGINVK